MSYLFILCEKGTKKYHSWQISPPNVTLEEAIIYMHNHKTLNDKLYIAFCLQISPNHNVIFTNYLGE